jgi:hypothetical protein
VRAAQAQEVGHEAFGDLGMRLKRQDVVAIGQHAVAREAVAAEVLGAIGRLDHLVLMRRVHRQRQAAHVVDASPQRPAALVFLDPSAEGLRHDLVAEADADERATRIADIADELLQRGDPRAVLVDAMGRAGDQPGIRRFGPLGENAVHHLPEPQLEATRFEQAGEHVEIAAVKRAGLVGHAAGLQDAEDHRSLMSFQ